MGDILRTDSMTIQTLFGTDEGERGENRRDHKGSPLIYEDHRGATHTHINRQQGRLNIKRTKKQHDLRGRVGDVEMNGPVFFSFFKKILKMLVNQP